MWLFMSWLEERVDPSLCPQRGLYAGSTLSGPSSFLSDWPALRDTHRVQSVPAHNQDYLLAWKACKINHKIHGHDPFLTSTLGARKTHMVALGQICSKLVQSLTNYSTRVALTSITGSIQINTGTGFHKILKSIIFKREIFTKKSLFPRQIPLICCEQKGKNTTIFTQVKVKWLILK